MTGVTEQDGPPIVAGYEWNLIVEIEADEPPFPNGAALSAQVRKTVSDPVILATLTTGNGGLTIVDPATVRITLTGAQTAPMKAGHVVMDLIRTDLTPDAHLGFRIEVPVTIPVTRGLIP